MRLWRLWRFFGDIWGEIAREGVFKPCQFLAFGVLPSSSRIVRGRSIPLAQGDLQS